MMGASCKQPQPHWKSVLEATQIYFSLRGRMNSIKSIIQALRKRVLSDFLHERHLTVFDALERCLKKGELSMIHMDGQTLYSALTE